jgi:hypothetical protein
MSTPASPSVPRHAPLLAPIAFREYQYAHTISAADVGIDSALIAFWRKIGVLPFFEKGKRARFSYLQVLWLRVLYTLRELNNSVDMLKKFSDYFIKRAYDDDLPKKNLLESKSNLEKKMTLGLLTKEESMTLKKIDEYLHDETLMYVLKWDINYFSNLVNLCLDTEQEAAILIYPDGTISEFLGGQLIWQSKDDRDLSGPHIYLPISHFLSEFIADEHLQKYISPLELLDEDEYRLLREIRNKNIDEIIISLKEGKMLSIKSAMRGTITGEQARMVQRTLGIRNYEEITVRTMDEKSLSFKHIKKIK